MQKEKLYGFFVFLPSNIFYNENLSIPVLCASVTGVRHTCAYVYVRLCVCDTARGLNIGLHFMCFPFFGHIHLQLFFCWCGGVGGRQCCWFRTPSSFLTLTQPALVAIEKSGEREMEGVVCAWKDELREYCCWSSWNVGLRSGKELICIVCCVLDWQKFFETLKLEKIRSEKPVIFQRVLIFLMCILLFSICLFLNWKVKKSTERIVQNV